MAPDDQRPGTGDRTAADARYKTGEVVSLRGSGAAMGVIVGQGDSPGAHIVIPFWPGAGCEPGATCAIVIKPGDIEGADRGETYIARVDGMVSLEEACIAGSVGHLGRAKLREVMRAWVGLATRNFSRAFHAENLPAADAGRCGARGAIPYAGRVFKEEEVEAAVGAALDFWLTLGPEGEALEKELAEFLGVKRSILVNSGSSANLLAISALTSHKLPPERRLRAGDEVITCAAGFPTTVAPIIQAGAVPVFIDADPATLNARVEQLEEAFVEGRTKGVIMAHALGNPFDLAAVGDFCARHGLWLIEDNCDALGSTYDGRPTGAFGDLSTQSFYPPHHMTMGEGGAVNVVRDMRFKVLIESFRDWGRDCWCASGKDNTCHKRFGWQLGELPEGYDHKYIYSHLGYNLKPLDIQAAIGRRQLTRLPSFIAARRSNWLYLREALEGLEEFFEFQLPTHAGGWARGGFTWDASGHRSDPSWFGFLLLVRRGAPFRHSDLARHLDENKIGNRMLFGGNLVRQPAFVEIRRGSSAAFRIRGLSTAKTAAVASSEIGALLSGADRIMHGALFVGTFPGLGRPELDRIAEVVRSFVRKH